MLSAIERESHPSTARSGLLRREVAVVREKVLGRIRAICLALPETSERLSHGSPTFFVRGKRAFMMVLTNHHGDGRFAIWCAAPEGVQQLLTEADPENFFVPPLRRATGLVGRPARSRTRL